jgi:hypothetical protein
MKSNLLKRFVPAVLGGAAMLVLAMPMTASAHEWNHHENARPAATWAHRDFHPNWNRDSHPNWNHHEWERHEAFRPAPQAYYPRAYYAPQPVAPMYAAPAYAAPGYAAGYAAPFGRGAGCNEARMQNVYRHDRRTGHSAAANDIARRMRNCGGNVYGQNSYYGNGYYGQNSVFQPMGSMLGLW